MDDFELGFIMVEVEFELSENVLNIKPKKIFHLQTWSNDYKRLLYKPYVNEVT